jgi:YrbI family 3-deoxy-D-manno-octulosonate 8-phosphate phosphatase
MSSIKLIVYDFDGVMTDNRLLVDQEGRESVQVNRADGLGVSEIKKLGIKQIILSTEKNQIVQVRAAKLGIPCLQGVENKAEKLTGYCIKNKISLSDVAYVGNDINDLKVMRLVGLTICPADAHPKIQNISMHILTKNGGEGVARELFDYIKNIN